MSGFLGLLFSNGGSGGTPPVTPSEYIAYGSNAAAKRISVYNWNSASGFGSLFVTPTVSNSIRQASFVRDNSVLCASFNAAPYFNVWQWSGLGFGTQYSSPTSNLNPATAGPAGFTWTNNVDAILTANVGAPQYPQAWPWTSGSGFGSKYSNGSSFSGSGYGASIALNSSNNQVAFVSYYSPSVHLYPWSSLSGFGTKYSNPLTGAGNNNGQYGTLSFNSATNDIAFAIDAFPFVNSYAVSSSGFGSKYSNPATGIGGEVYSVRFSPDGQSIAIGNINSPNSLRVYAWGAGFGAAYASPSISTYVQSADWSSTTTAIAAGIPATSPFTKVYSWTSSGFGAAYSAPSTAPGQPNSVSFSNQSR
jgi:hypothetical protein